LFIAYHFENKCFIQNVKQLEQFIWEEIPCESQALSSNWMLLLRIIVC